MARHRTRKARFTTGRAALVALALSALVACETTVAPKGPVPTPPARPQATPVAPQPIALGQGASAELATKYAKLERDLLVKGLLRRDGGGPDTRFTAEDLADNFVRIALFNERSSGAATVSGAGLLRRWQSPVRVQLHFGPSIPSAVRDKDRRALANLTGRLSRAARHPVSLVSGGSNFHVLVLSEGERRNAGPIIQSIMPGLDPAVIRVVEGIPRSTYCLVFNFRSPGSPYITQALAVIRAENPDLLRLSCLHEEVTQGLGLTNDSPKARPSIFNDDEEFATLTAHDELLLRMLYDRRLQPGMTAEEVRPIALQIARGLVAGGA